MAKAHQKIELNALRRDVTGTRVRHLRTSGVIPAVLYGKGMPAVSLQVPVKDFEKTLKAAGESTLVYLNVDGQAYPTIIHDVTREPVKDAILHADFYKVRLDEKIKTNVPVVFTGESPMVKDQTGIFVRNVNELEVEALPQDLPHEITIDISGMATIGDQILAKDIRLGSGVALTAGPEEIIATIQAAKTQEELEAELAAPTTDVSTVEEIKKEKEEETPAEGEEAIPAPAPEEKAEK